MNTPVFQYATDKDGRPAAHPIAGAHPELAAYLTEEASWPDYVDVLADSLAKPAVPGHPAVHSGNAWAATVHADHVTLDHLHRKDHKRATVPRAVFAQALGEWRDFLAKTAP